MGPSTSRVHRKFRQALLKGDLRQVQHVINGHAAAQKSTQQDALADLMCYIFDDDCCGSGVLYLAAGCKMTHRSLLLPAAAGSGSGRGRGSRPSVFDRCITQDGDCTASISAAAAAANPPAAAAVEASKCSSSYAAAFSRWYHGGSSSSGSSKLLDPDIGRAEILQWMLHVMSDKNNITWLGLDTVNTRCQTALHLCLLNGSSPSVLRLLLDHVSSSSSGSSGSKDLLQAIWGIEDSACCTPLDLAITLQNWHCVSLMLAAGAAAAASSSSSTGMAAAQQIIAGLLPGNARPRLPAAAVGSSNSGSGGVSGLITGLVKAAVAAASSSSSSSSEQHMDKRLRSSSIAVDQTAVQSSDVSAVASELKQAVQHVTYVTNLPPATAMSLLAANGYNADRAIDAAFAGSSMTAGNSSSSVVVDGSSSSSNSGSSNRCIVCFESTADPDNSDRDKNFTNGDSNENNTENNKITMSVHLPCGHVTCDSCWQGIVTACVEGLGVQRAGCPHPGCGALLPLDDVERLVTPQMYQRYLSLLAQHVINTSSARRWCPAPGCGRSLRLNPESQQQQRAGSSSGSRGFGVQCACGCKFCWVCQEPAHEPATCQQVVSWRQLLTSAAATAESRTAAWVTAHTRCCPQCNSRIQRDGGCNHMTCRVCNREFCWVCGRDWSQHSQSTGGYYVCFLQPTAAAAAGSAEDQPLHSRSNTPQQQQQQQQQQGSVISNLFGSAVAAMKDVVLNHKQKLYLGLHLQHEVDLDRLKILLRYQQLLLAAVLGQEQQQQQQEDSDARPTGLRSLLHVIASEQQQQHHGQQQQHDPILQQLAELPDLPPSPHHPQPQQQQQGVSLHFGAGPTVQGYSELQQQQQQRQQRIDTQGFEPLKADLISEWLGCISECKETLRWSCVLGYYIKSAASRRYLEHLQDRLSIPIEQLLAVIQQLPGAQQVVDAAAAAAAKRQAAAAGTAAAAVARTVRSLWGRFWQQLGYNSSSGSSAGNTPATAAAAAAGRDPNIGLAQCTDLWFDLPADLLQRQVYYALALSRRFIDIKILINNAKRSQGALITSARSGIFDDHDLSNVRSSTAAAAAGSSDPAGSSQGPRVTVLDVVAAGTDPEVLIEAVSAGVGHLWRSFVGGR